jgi:predicted Zn-ribbon and HTH transcriptional regulator
MNVAPQHFDDLICPQCKMETVYMDMNLGYITERPIPIKQKHPYCSNCGFTAETEFGFIDKKKIPSFCVPLHSDRIVIHV